jgi:hypothetical protein
MRDAGTLVRSHDTDQTARIKNISHRISDEINVVDKKLMDAERLQGGTSK